MSLQIIKRKNVGAQKKIGYFGIKNKKVKCDRNIIHKIYHIIVEWAGGGTRNSIITPTLCCSMQQF